VENAPQLPAVHPQCSIALRITFMSEDEGEHPMRLCFVDADGKNVMPAMDIPVNIVLPDDSHFVTRNFIVNIQQMKFAQAGLYSIDIFFGERLLIGIPLMVKHVSPGPPPLEGDEWKTQPAPAPGAGRGRADADFYLPHGAPKQLYLRELRPRARQRLRQARLPAELAVHEADRAGPCPFRAPALASLLGRFAALPDARRGHGLKHHQRFVLACAAVSTLMGACGYRAFENTCKKPSASSAPWALPPPSDSTFQRVLKKLDAGRFATLVGGWLAEQEIGALARLAAMARCCAAAAAMASCIALGPSPITCA
jgi:hypothetical protein